MRTARLVTVGLVLTLQAGCVEKLSGYRIVTTPPSDLAGFSTALYQATAVELQSGHEVELANNGPFFDALEAQLRKATQSINIVVFIWRPGDPSNRVIEAVTARAAHGVKCRVLVDELGSLEFDSKVRPRLEAAGCEVAIFRPVSQKPTLDRNHRKIFVIDGKVALTGGVGIFKVWLGDGRSKDHWRDTNVLVRGPAVRQLQQAFAENWLEQTGRLLPDADFAPLTQAGGMVAGFVSSTGHPTLTRAERLTQVTMAAAKRRLWLANAYFLPSPGMLDLLREKATSGVDVRVMTPSDTTDHPEILAMQRARYDDLLAAGVRIFEYQPTMFHSKTMLVDEALSVVGSINLDRLSQDWLEEGSLVVYDRGFAKQMEADWLADTAHCKEVTSVR